MFLDQGEALFSLLRPLLKQQKGLSQEELAYGNDILAKYEEQCRSNPAKKEVQHSVVPIPKGTSLQSEEKVGTTSKVVNGLEPEPLTKRDLEILDGLSIGMSNADLASLLGLSIGTIKVYVHQLYVKLGVTSRAQAVVKAREQNLSPRV
jgi:ATP/maltotriose-dependent transcriptional regulator MalT